MISPLSGEKLCSGACQASRCFSAPKQQHWFWISEQQQCVLVSRGSRERGAVDRTLGLLEALWSGMCFAGWGRQRLVDTEETNYPLIIPCWQRVWVVGRYKEWENEGDTGWDRRWRQKCEKQKQAEKKWDSVFLLSRVFDVLTVTCWMRHKRIGGDYWLSRDHPVERTQRVQLLCLPQRAAASAAAILTATVQPTTHSV